jgi:hypothetical protein
MASLPFAQLLHWCPPARAASANPRGRRSRADPLRRSRSGLLRDATSTYTRSVARWPGGEHELPSFFFCVCDAPGFRSGALTLMSRSTKLTFVKRRSTWAITSKTSLTIPRDPPWSTYGQTLVKNTLNTLCPPMSLGTFVAFSKYHLNTSESPNVKVV